MLCLLVGNSGSLEAGYNQLAAMRGDEKLVVTSGGRPELFDVKTDPAERRNLSGLRPERIKILNAELKSWLGTEVEHQRPMDFGHLPGGGEFRSPPESSSNPRARPA